MPVKRRANAADVAAGISALGRPSVSVRERRNAVASGNAGKLEREYVRVRDRDRDRQREACYLRL